MNVRYVYFNALTISLKKKSGSDYLDFGGKGQYMLNKF